jgi:hypothetical protein
MPAVVSGFLQLFPISSEIELNQILLAPILLALIAVQEPLCVHDSTRADRSNGRS